MLIKHLRFGAALAAFASTLIADGLAEAHVSVASGVGFANATNEVAFGVGHGCNGHDTYKVVLDIPAGVTAVRTLTSDFGPATVTVDAMGNVTTVTWQKPLANLLPSDTAYYKLSARMRLPDAPYTSVYFKFHQTCRDSTGVEETVDWVGLPTDPAVPDGGVGRTRGPASHCARSRSRLEQVHAAGGRGGRVGGPARILRRCAHRLARHGRVQPEPEHRRGHHDNAGRHGAERRSPRRTSSG